MNASPSRPIVVCPAVKNKRSENECSRGAVSPSMDAQELRKRAEHYRRVAMVVSDEDLAKELLKLAERYEALARTQEEPPAGDDRG
jgi:hypothetical protein